MFSKILVKLIDQAIVPAILLLAAKIASIVLIGKYLNISYSLGPMGFTYTTTKDYVLVNSYSTFTMIGVLAVGLFYILLKSLVLHDSHITPKLTAKLFSLRLSTFMQSSYDLYSQGVIWMSYSYLLLLASAIMAIFGIIESWVFATSLVVTVLSSILFILDVENELATKIAKKTEDDEEVTILNLGDTDE